MKDLAKGIYDKFLTANTFKTYVGSRMYLEEAPQGVTYPYATYHLDSIVHEWNFGTDYYDASVMFNLFSNTASGSELFTMHDYLTTLYDDCLLTVTGYKHIYMIRMFGKLNKEFDANLNKSIWQYSVEYGVYLQKN